MKKHNHIEIIGAKSHNLKIERLTIPHNTLTVITGVSGSGKSTLAFGTLHAEAQRRYLESLNAYARQFLGMMEKPDVQSITGLSPSVSIEQKTTSRNPRSTVGTITEIHDHLRLLFSRGGTPHSPTTGKPIEAMQTQDMVDKILSWPKGERWMICAPMVVDRKGEHKKEFQNWTRQGYQRFLINGETVDADSLPNLDKNKRHNIDIVVDRLIVGKTDPTRLSDSLRTALNLAAGTVILRNPDTGSHHLFSENHACPVSGFSLPDMEPRLFSFNAPHGACEDCQGIGHHRRFDPDKIVPDPTLTFLQGAIAPWGDWDEIKTQRTQTLFSHLGITAGTRWEDLPHHAQDALMLGWNTQGEHHKGPQMFHGILKSLQRQWDHPTGPWVRDDLDKYRSDFRCETCQGRRLNEKALCVQIKGKNIADVSEMTIKEALDWTARTQGRLGTQKNTIVEPVFHEIRNRLTFLSNVGLDYLTLSREAGTLSGGESQRIRLASQIGSGLTGVLYILDEPSIGLHPKDNDRLIHTLETLRDTGNTVLVVEHDEEIMRRADHIIDMGPKAGTQGGTVVAQGSFTKICKHKTSLTAQHLTGKKQVFRRDTPRIQPGPQLTLTGCRANNLKNIDVTIPLQKMVCVTGVSGSGKSSLVTHTLKMEVERLLKGRGRKTQWCDNIQGLDEIDKMIVIDQTPIGRTPRSNPATYIGMFNAIRDWFTNLPEAKARGYKPGRFSFNVKGGRCEACQGDGVLKIEMNFLPDVYVTCETCKGKRYNRETLEILHKGKSIADVLDMSVDEALNFFAALPQIRRKLQTLVDVGLGYITLGQGAPTLSGGEAQRIKLAKELSKVATGKTLYILDEPTTGLHFEDISLLMKAMNALVDQGNSLVVIEHNLDVIAGSDHIIDIGPDGGDRGGHVVDTGTPQEIAQQQKGHTGVHLQKHITQQTQNHKNLA